MKIQKTFTIEKEINKEFDKLSKEKSLNKSLFIENCMKEFIEKIKKANEMDQKEYRRIN